MKSVYQTSLGIEAHLIKNLLTTEGFDSEIFGEHLQGGIGDLSAIGIIRVMVADDDYQAARRIVDQWEASQPAVVDAEPEQKKSGYGGAMLGFVLGCIVSGLLVLLLTRTPVSNDGIDYNNDGVLDERWQYSNGTLDWLKYDQNRDGAVDHIYKYDLRGLIKSLSADRDFDGRYEYRCRYEAGNTTRCLGDFDNDGFQEYREDYSQGVLYSSSLFDARSQRLRKVQYYKSGRLKRAKVDQDGDGYFELQYEYDEFDDPK